MSILTQLKSKNPGTGSFDKGDAGGHSEGSEDEDDDARSEDEKGDAGIHSEGREDEDDDEDEFVKFEKMKPHNPSGVRWATRNENLLQVRSRFACRSFPSFEHLERDRSDLPLKVDNVF